MGFYVIWLYFVGMFFIFSLASTPLLRWADLPPTMVPVRVQTIDGLRGFLALGVFFHHGVIYHQYLLTAWWALPPSRFYANLGQAGVAMFFMITGCLFWTQMLKAKGRPNFLKLYIGRAFRIIPLYLLLAFVVLLGVGHLTGWRLQEPVSMLTRHVVRWLAGGVLLGGDVNGSAAGGLIAASVTWSLQYEWMFYASLLVTFLFARRIILGALFPVIGLLLTAPVLVWHPNNQYIAGALMFLVGMTAASARCGFVTQPLQTPQWMLSALVVGCLAGVLLGFDGVYHTLPIMILGVAFGLIVSGATVFGLLLTRPAKRLGDVSYGIYLLQGPVLFLAFASPLVRSYVTTSSWGHWAVVMMAGVTLVMLATVTHCLIERPCVAAGQRVYAKIVSMQRPKHYRARVEAEG